MRPRDRPKSAAELVEMLGAAGPEGGRSWPAAWQLRPPRPERRPEKAAVRVHAIAWVGSLPLLPP